MAHRDVVEESLRALAEGHGELPPVTHEPCEKGLFTGEGFGRIGS